MCALNEVKGMKLSMKVILIAGKAGSGKNEVASMLKKYLPNTVITSFSKYIKLFALEFTDWDGRDINKPREFLQTMGDTLRSIDQNFLIKRILEDFKVYEKSFDNVIISDVRLPYELEYIKQNCGYDVITIRVNATKSMRTLTESEKKHHTELEFDNYNKFDYVINNHFDKNLEKDVNEIRKRIG